MREVDDENDMDELKARRICSKCVGDEFLKKEIIAGDQEATCDYCDQSGKTISIEELANRIEAAFQSHYIRTAIEPTDFEYAMAKDSGGGWNRHGDQVEWAIAGAAVIDEAPARHVLQILSDRYSDYDAAQMGDETEFDADSYYERKDISDLDFWGYWKDFEGSVKCTNRHFNSEAEAILDKIFGDINEHKTGNGTPLIIEAGPDKNVNGFYRARVFQSSRDLLDALKYPDREIGPPPTQAALAGRMNAHGVSVFYGATTSQTAIAEVRPPVGSRVVVGHFELLRSIRLLDIRALKDIAVDGSVFDPSYKVRLERASFFEHLSEQISRAVMPNDERLDYIVTQAVADYLATRKSPCLDGIIYSSPQQSNGGANVVLFHKSSGVQVEMLPPGSTVDAEDRFYTVDEYGYEYEYDYSVREEVPTLKDKNNSAQKNHGVQNLIRSRYECSLDSRNASLKLDIKDVYVHHVDAVEYKTSSYKVKRHRTEKCEDTSVSMSEDDIPF